MQTSTYDLYTLGWTPELTRAFAEHRGRGLVPGRVGGQHRGGLVLYANGGEVPAVPSGRLRHRAAPGELPVAGDWVAARLAPDGGRALVEAILPRRTALLRATTDLTRPEAAAGAQVVAANADIAFVVSAAGSELDPRRLERYLAAAWESGARPVIAITKIDLVDDLDGPLAELAAVAPGVPVYAVSNVTGTGVEDVRALLAPGRTAVLLGSSGVGKSSLVNRLVGTDRQAVAETRADGRGRHTTTHRELLLVPRGGLVLDTPGMRALTPWDDGGLDDAFGDVEALASDCRFSGCRHDSEPGCAVRAAIERGHLRSDRLEGYAKLRRELAFLERRGDKRAEADERKRWRGLERELRQRAKGRR